MGVGDARPASRLTRRPQYLPGWLAGEPARAWLAAFMAAWPQPVYLVGGSVRDALLGRDTMDLDFAVDGSALGLARALADRAGGALVVMDAERDVARVVMGRGDQAQHWDLAGLRASTIEADLRARDLTINAMALAMRPPHALLDPTGGCDDLTRGLLRCAGESAFSDDPVRVLRLARFRCELGLPVLPATRRLAAQAVPLLAESSPERLRDELFAILRLDRAAMALGYLARLGALAPALCLAQEQAKASLGGGLGRLRALEDWAGDRICDGAVEGAMHGARHAVCGTGRLLLQDWERVLAGGRTRCQAAKLAALMAALGSQVAEAVCLALRLSSAEVRWVRGAVAGSEALATGLDGDGDVALYRYYRRYGEAGVDGAVLSLVGGEQSRAAEALMAWFQRRAQVVDPPRLVNGRDVMRVWGAGSGPAVGRALEAIREAQVAGKMASREEALRWIERRALGDNPAR